NEAAGYGGVAAAAALSGWLAADYVARDVLAAGGAVIAVAALVTTLAFVRDTADHVALEQRRRRDRAPSRARLRDAFPDATYRVPALRSCSQAGLVNNLNDALTWGLVPLFLASHGAGTGEVGLVAGAYPAVWGAGQILAGHWSDRLGRKPLIVAGMLVPALAAAAALGAGTALVYPALIARISDEVDPVARVPAVGVYRFWRDMGYVVGGVVSGLLADALGFGGALAAVAALTALSGLWVAIDLPGPRPRRRGLQGAAAPTMPGA